MTTTENDVLKRDIEQAVLDYTRFFPAPPFKLAPNLDLAVRALHEIYLLEDERDFWEDACRQAEDNTRLARSGIIEQSIKLGAIRKVIDDNS